MNIFKIKKILNFRKQPIAYSLFRHRFHPYEFFSVACRLQAVA